MTLCCQMADGETDKHNKQIGEIQPVEHLCSYIKTVL